MGASEIAKELGIKIYTIGIGAKEIQIPVPFGHTTIKNNELDENLLKNIASMTGGEYLELVTRESFRRFLIK